MEVHSLNFIGGVYDPAANIIANNGIGSALYLNASGQYDLASGASTTTMPCIALSTSVETGADQQVLTMGFIDNPSWTWTVGGVPGLIYISALTAGLLTQSLPDVSTNQCQVVGFAVSATKIFFNPNYILVEVK